VIGPTQGPLPDNTQHSQETDIHAPDGIRTHNPIQQAVADPRLDRAATGIGDHNSNDNNNNNNNNNNNKSTLL
jgi:hypothetical protein